MSAVYKYSKQSGIKFYDTAQEFNLIKVNFNCIGRYEDEDKAYVEYKRCMRKALIKDRPPEKTVSDIHQKLIALLLQIFNYIRVFFNWLLFDLMSCYCTKPFRVLLSAVITILIFGIFYNLTGTIEFSVNGNYEGLIGCFYHSIITFFTIGYGDSKPTELWGLLMTGLEGFAGVFMMSLFTVSFVRKVLR